jgi:hypothetical protein
MFDKIAAENKIPQPQLKVLLQMLLQAVLGVPEVLAAW